MQSSWYSFSSWPYIDITPGFRSFSNLHFLGVAFFLKQKCFWNRISNLFWSIHVGFSATRNTCDRYNKLVIDHLKIILCTIQWILSNPNFKHSLIELTVLLEFCQSVCSIRVVCIQSMAH